jgi:hypothetical protein
MSETNKPKQLTLQEILENPVEFLDIPGIGFVKVKLPTTKDKLEAKRIAIENTKGFDNNDQRVEISRILALKMLVEPQITLEDYLLTNDVKISIILDTIDIWYNLKYKELNDKRKGLIDNFLKVMRADNQ